MKPYSYIISKPSEIEGVIRAFRSLGAKGCSLLISIFTAYTKKDGLQEMVDALSLAFPEAEISGMTSSVCIEQGVNRTEKIIILSKSSKRHISTRSASTMHRERRTLSDGP